MTLFWSPESQKRISDAVRKIERHTDDVTTPQRPPLVRIPHDFRRFRLITDIDPFDEISSAVRGLLSASDLAEIESGTVKGVGIAIHLRRINGVLTTGETFTVVDLIGTYTGGAATSTTDAAEGWCIHPHDRDWWEIVELAQAGDTSIWVEMKTSLPSDGMSAALVAGQSATAHPRDWNGSAWVTDTSASREFTVVDVRGVYRARAKDALGSPNDEGSIARVKFNATSEQWEIRELTAIALIVEGKVDESGGVAHTDGTFVVDGLGVMQPHGGLLPAVSFTGANEARNVLGFPADNLADAVNFWNEKDLKWDAIPKPPLKTIDPVTSIDYDTSDHEFKLKKTQNTLVFQSDDEDANFDVQPAWHANVLETFTVTVSGSSAGLTRSREEFYVQEAGDVHAEGANFEYLDGTTCA